MDKRGGGGRRYHDILSENFCLTVAKILAAEPFCAAFQKISSSQIFMYRRSEGKYNDFPSRISFSQCQKLWSRNPSLCHKYFCFEKKADKLGVVRHTISR